MSTYLGRLAAVTADLTETFTIYWDGTDVFKKTTPSVAKFYTTRFSGYVLASGRSRVY